MKHMLDVPVTVLELENLPDGRQRLSIGVPKEDGVTQVLHLFGRLELEEVDSIKDFPLNYGLVMHAFTGGPMLMELRIQLPEDEPLEPECHS